MSKQSEARARQGYTTEPRNCGNCAQRTCTRDFPTWIKKSIARGHTGYSAEHHKVESNHRCMVGGFAVQKTARCDHWAKQSNGSGA